MESSLIDTLLAALSGIISVDMLKTLAPIVALAAIVSAFTSSKFTHRNSIIQLLGQTVIDVINIIAFNIVKAKNADDPVE